MFVKDQVYKRSELHDLYGGNRQGGISPSRKSDVIFLFTGDSGIEYGYEDGWKEDGIFYYTGEGQIGNMEFNRGNKAIKDHLSNGKSLHLFKKLSGGYVQYCGEMIFMGYHLKDGFDRQNNARQLIVFHLQRKHISNKMGISTKQISSENLAQNADKWQSKEEKLNYLLTKVKISQKRGGNKKRF